MSEVSELLGEVTILAVLFVRYYITNLFCLDLLSTWVGLLSNRVGLLSNGVGLFSGERVLESMPTPPL